MLQINAEAFPLVELHFIETFSDAELNRFETYFMTHFEAGDRIGMAVRTTELALPELRILKGLAAWLNQSKAKLDGCIVCSGLYIPSAALRGATKFVTAIAPNNYPQKTFATWPATLVWVREQLAQAEPPVLKPGEKMLYTAS